jgi:hypothetical protein
VTQTGSVPDNASWTPIQTLDLPFQISDLATKSTVESLPGCREARTIFGDFSPRLILWRYWRRRILRCAVAFGLSP